LADSGRRQLVGLVLPSKMDKTAVVQVTRRFAHPIYKKVVSKNKKYYADDQANIAQAGDTVRIIEARQLSKLKRWRLVEVTKKAESLK
jgi:small subunit ribosomal protein S17